MKTKENAGDDFIAKRRRHLLTDHDEMMGGDTEMDDHELEELADLLGPLPGDAEPEAARSSRAAKGRQLLTKVQRLAQARRTITVVPEPTGTQIAA